MSATFQILRSDRPEGVASFLRERGWLRPSEHVIRMEPAGAGNMNLVLRVETGQRSFILKQSRPWVEKYPDIPAPEDRIVTEVAFYRFVRGPGTVAAGMPDLLEADSSTRTALFEDLGPSADCTDLYRGADLETGPLVDWLAALHSERPGPGARRAFRNRAMRSLNHAHIFRIPFEPGIEAFTHPGLGDVAAEWRTDGGLMECIGRLGEIYLDDGPVLLHGDFYPGSWLRTADGPRIIDPEFCFCGPREFDLGVLKAHLMFGGFSTARIGEVLRRYGGPVDTALMNQFAGVELARRLLGVAQLPLETDLNGRIALLEQARNLLRPA